MKEKSPRHIHRTLHFGVLFPLFNLTLCRASNEKDSLKSIMNGVNHQLINSITPFNPFFTIGPQYPTKSRSFTLPLVMKYFSLTLLIQTLKRIFTCNWSFNPSNIRNPFFAITVSLSVIMVNSEPFCRN